MRLLARLPGVSKIITEDECASSFDLWGRLMSLSYAGDTIPETIPTTTPYLTADLRTWLTGASGLPVLPVCCSDCAGLAGDRTSITAGRSLSMHRRRLGSFIVRHRTSAMIA